MMNGCHEYLINFDSYFCILTFFIIVAQYPDKMAYFCTVLTISAKTGLILAISVGFRCIYYEKH